MTSITWKYVDYGNDSLNNIARNIAEFHTANASKINFDTHTGIPIGTIFLDEEYTVEDTDVLNSLLNYNVYFKKNTDDKILTDLNFDSAVVLASGSSPLQVDAKNKYIIDISPRALEKTKDFLDLPASSYYQVDLFNLDQVRNFLQVCTGNTGIFCMSNVFLYLPNCIMFDSKVRLKKQNQIIELLANDKINWHVDIVTVNGNHIQAPAEQLVDIKLDKKFEVLPWI